MCALSYGGNKHGLNYNPGEGGKEKEKEKEEGKKKKQRKAQPWFASSASGGIFRVSARDAVVTLGLKFIEKGTQ